VSTPTIKEKLSPAGVAAASQTLTTGAGTAVGDMLVLFHFYDYYTLADMLTPTGGGSWTHNLPDGDSGASHMHVKVWNRLVVTGGAQTVTVNSTPTDATHMPVLFVLDGAMTITTDGMSGSNGTASTSHVCPSVSPVGSDDLLLCGAGMSPDAAGNYTAPSGMTKESEVDVGTFSTAATFSQVLSASGATGTRTATSSVSQIWCSATIALRGVPTPAARTNVVNQAAIIRASQW
jgi:hypothetical protein